MANSAAACSTQGEDRFAIWAANGGSPAHPNWYYNLKANPEITVEVGAQTFTVLGGGTGRHRPSRAVAEAGGGVAEAGGGVP
jgi:hypothetical protein